MNDEACAAGPMLRSLRNAGDNDDDAKDLLLRPERRSPRRHHHHHVHDDGSCSSYSRGGEDDDGRVDEVYQLLLEDSGANGSRAAATGARTTTPATTLPTANNNNNNNLPIGAVANLCSATLGAGVLAIPYAMYQAGLVAGGFLMVMAGFATYGSIVILSHCAGHYGISDNNGGYEELVERVLHQPGYRRLVEVSLLLFCGGCAVAYAIAVGDILDQAGLLLFGHSRALSLMFVWTMFMMPLSMLRRMNSIAGASAIGVSAIGTLVFGAAVHVLTTPHVHHQNHHSNIHYAGLAAVSRFLWPAHGSWISVLTACPVVLFAFSCQPNVCAIYAELPHAHTAAPTTTTTAAAVAVRNAAPLLRRREEEQRRATMNRVAAASVGLCAALYIAISAFCLADFGSSVLPNLLLNYRFQKSRDDDDDENHNDDGGDNNSAPRDSIMQVATAAMAVAVILAYPLNIFPARVTLIGLLDQKNGGGDSARGGYGGCYPPVTDNNANGVHDNDHDDVGTTTTNNTTANGRNGRANANLTQALLQDLAEERAETAIGPRGDDENNNDDDDCGGVAANTTTGNGGPRVTSTNGYHHSNGNVVAPPSPATALTTPPLPPFHWQQHVVVTLFLTGTSLALALIIPDIKVLFGLLGGTASSIIGFCIPGLLGLQLSKDLLNDHHGDDDDDDDADENTGTTTTTDTARRTRVVSWCLLVGGALVGAVTTVATIYEIALTHRRP